jgi:hypothetical protein
MRRVVIALGVLVGLYGGYLLLSRQTLTQLVQVAEWAAVAVLLHDALLAPLVVVVGVVVRRAGAPPAAVVGAVVLGTTTIAALAVLNRSHANGSNATLLPRDYPWWWLAFAAVVAVVATVAATTAAVRHARVRRRSG